MSQSCIKDNEKLVTICKVWGFLKYYHPKVASGQTNWNQELLEILPEIEKVQTKEDFSLLLEKWIAKQGKIEKIAPIIEPKDVAYFDKNFDLSWIHNNKLFSKKLSEKLQFIEKNRYQGKQYYVGTHNAGNIFVTNEDYSKIDFTNKQSRILALFAYWNLVEYFFPYKYLMDKNWDETLGELLVFFLNAKTEDDFYEALQKLAVRMNDSHTAFHKYSKNTRNYFPAKCKIIEEKIVVSQILSDSLAKADSIQMGDIITKVNDKTIKEIIAEKRDFIAGSNEAFYLENLVNSVLSGFSNTITLEFLKNNNKQVTKTLHLHDYLLFDAHKRKKIKKDKFKILSNNTGYVDLGLLKVKDISEMIANLKNTKAIIFDMRNYPNGTYEGISKFLNSKEKEFAIYTKPDLSYPGKFKWTEAQKCGSENKDNYKGKIILLLNETSISQAEWTAMAFKTADNTTIIGSQTAGADGNVTEIDFIKGIYTRFSGIGVYYPNKSETQRIGIVPDIEVKPSIKGIQQGKDEVLERALQFIETGS